MASSKHLGVLPETLGEMEVLDWVPVDLLSTIMIEILGTVLGGTRDGKDKIAVYNLVNPRTTTWSEVRQDVQKFAGIAKSVSLREWMKMLEASSRERNGAVVATNPAVKLLDFFRLMSSTEGTSGSRFEVANLVSDSPHAAEMPAVSSAWLRLWIRQWDL